MEQVLAAELYTLDLVSTPQWIVRNSDADWPEVLDRRNAIEITFTTGATASSREIGLMKAAVLGLVGQWYDAGLIGAMPDAIRQMLAPYRRIRI